MSTGKSSMFRERVDRALASPLRASRMSSLVYRSRCIEPMAPDDLNRMVESSRVRNRAASITGLLICEDDHFLQWLEGPNDGLARLWRSIRIDHRHTDIEILGDAPTPVRSFGAWDMQLATKRTMIPAAVRLAASRTGSGLVAPRHDLRRSDEDLCTDDLTPHPHVGELARLLIAADPGNASKLIDELHADGHTMAHLCATVLEPAARLLGDLWRADDCTEFDVTLGLCRLQMAARRLNSSVVPRPIPVSRLRSVLVAPMPGECHSLSAMLDAELLWQAGWEMRCELPDSTAALCHLLAGQWFDVLDLTLSTAFERDHWLARLAQTIACARAASRNPTLRVVVGGRVFFEDAFRHVEVGADAGCSTARRIESVLSDLF